MVETSPSDPSDATRDHREYDLPKLPTHLPVTSLEDSRIELLRRKQYSVEPGEEFSDETYKLAIGMTGGLRRKHITDRVYAELRRTWDMIGLIDKEDPNSESARELVESVVAFQRELIETIIQIPAGKKLSQQE